ncbi:MAG: alpha/beta hydrolase [Burkholderiales bacterium]|nr:alpha/beta hydrolase [Burkholderiales bacterium]
MALDGIEIETGDDPTASIIMLHGLGADGNDFVSFVDELDLSVVGAVRFVFPHSPVRPVTINGGHVMRAWYDILPPGMARREDEQGLRESQAEVEALITREQARGIEASRIVLAGFSQGGAMTLLTGLRRADQLAGLVGLSCYLPLADKTLDELSPANRDTPIFLAHGTSDPVVAFDRGQAARDALQALHYKVEWHEYPMPHSVCQAEITDLNQWLVRVLS